MIIKTKELKEALQAVKPGIDSREIIEQTSNYLFSGSFIISINERISVRFPFQTDFECSIKADDLFSIVSRTASDIWSHSLSGCPSVTDSEVSMYFGELAKLLVIFPPY